MDWEKVFGNVNMTAVIIGSILLVTLFSLMTPPATTLTLMAQVYGRDAVYANALNVISTVFA